MATSARNRGGGGADLSDKVWTAGTNSRRCPRQEQGALFQAGITRDLADVPPELQPGPIPRYVHPSPASDGWWGRPAGEDAETTRFDPASSQVSAGLWSVLKIASQGPNLATWLRIPRPPRWKAIATQGLSGSEHRPAPGPPGRASDARRRGSTPPASGRRLREPLPASPWSANVVAATWRRVPMLIR